MLLFIFFQDASFHIVMAFLQWAMEWNYLGDPIDSLNGDLGETFLVLFCDHFTVYVSLSKYYLW